MQTLALDTKEAPCKWFALQDRRMRNHVNRSLFSEAQCIKVERMRLALEICVSGRIYEPSYGRRSASVKVQAGARIVDPRQLALLEQDWAREGIYKKVSEQGFQYHLPR